MLHIKLALVSNPYPYIVKLTSVSLDIQRVSASSTSLKLSITKVFNFLKVEKGRVQPSSPARKWKNLTAKVVKAGKLRELGKYTLLNTPIRT